MGLCKCPKKKVTTLFCFEHRVNVCEYCLVENHANCVVQSYLQWLTDSDFDTNCTLCEHPLSEKPIIRLRCMHLVHWDCLDNWALRLPANTAPAGYRCPFCRDALFPAINETSPMIEQLKSQLQKSNWGRIGLGMPALPELNREVPPMPHNAYAVQQSKNDNHNPVAHNSHYPVYDAAHTHAHTNSNYRASTPATALQLEDPVYSQSQEQTFTSRKKHGGADSDSIPLLSSERERDVDSMANKYKRRPAREWLRGIWNAKYGNSPQQDQFSGYKKTLFVVFLCIVVLVTVIMILTRVGVGSETDPMFDPMANPNIRVAGGADESNLNAAI